MLFTEKGKDGKQTADYIGKPFDEWGADVKRHKYDQKLMQIYRKFYELGTTKTKEKIKETGLLK